MSDAVTAECAPQFLGNLSVFPQGICGTSKEIDDLAQFSMDLMSDEMNIEGLDDENDTMIQETLDKEMNALETHYTCTISREQHKKYYSGMFISFLKEHYLDHRIETIPEKTLNIYLRRFYYSLQKKDGTLYKPSTLVCVRAGIANYLTDAPNNRNINILSGSEFQSANNMLRAKVGQFLESSQEDVRHYDAIEEDDEQKVFDYFDGSTPEKLQDQAWYLIIKLLGFRGREWIRQLKRDSLKSCVDSSGKKFFSLAHPMKTKTRKASLNRRENENKQAGRIYENPSAVDCPYKAVESYLTKIAGCKTDTLFPKPCKTPGSKWYQERQVLGKDKLGNMMARISNLAGLSKRYTNHCLRPTYITQLKDAGFSNEEVCVLTGHKDERTVKKYDKRKSDRVLQNISNTLVRVDNSSIVEARVQNVKSGGASCSSYFSNCHFEQCKVFIMEKKLKKFS